MSWTGGSVVTRGRFLVVAGAVGGSPTVRLVVDDALFACADGLVCLLDDSTLPRPPRLQAAVKNCRFLVPEGRPLIEQAGIGTPESYRPAVDWSDAACRYEGSGVWRRIDAAAERLDLDFASRHKPFQHDPRITSWPAED